MTRQLTEQLHLGLQLLLHLHSREGSEQDPSAGEKRSARVGLLETCWPWEAQSAVLYEGTCGDVGLPRTNPRCGVLYGTGPVWCQYWDFLKHTEYSNTHFPLK